MHPVDFPFELAALTLYNIDVEFVLFGRGYDF